MGDDFDLTLVNAQHVKNVPGRKTDVKDSEWLCKLLKCGLMTKSFIPPKEIIRLRELVRYRQTLMKDLTSAKNRIIKMLENANIKLSSVFSNVFGVTAWTMVCKLVAGETSIEKLLEYIHKRCQSSKADIEKALQGTLEVEDRSILRRMMEHVSSIEALVAKIESDIEKHLKPYQEQVELLKTIPGIKDFAAEVKEKQRGLKDFLLEGNPLAPFVFPLPKSQSQAPLLAQLWPAQRKIHLPDKAQMMQAALFLKERL